MNANAAMETGSHPTAPPLITRFLPILLLVALCWLVFIINNLVLGGHLTQFGIRPRHVSSLLGIIWSPFLHVSFHHLAANTVPFLVLGAILCARSRREFLLVTIAGIVISGGLTWLIGRSAYHVGASGLIFCFFGYLTSLAFFRHKIGALLLSVVCLFGYGGLLRGLLPTSGAISWEGHLAGFITGVTLAWLSSELKPPDHKEPLAATTASINK